MKAVPDSPRLLPAALRVLLATLAGTALGCGESSADTGEQPVEHDGTPPAPRTERVDALAHFAEIAADAPTEPDERRAAQLLDLIETAWVPGYADTRLASRAADSLLAEDDAVRALESALYHDEANVRIQAAWNLSQIGDPVSLPPLVQRLRDEVDRRAQMWICDALWRLGCDTGLEFLPGFFLHAETMNDAGRSAIARVRAAGLPLSEEPTWDELTARIVEIHDHWTLHGIALRAEHHGPPSEDHDPEQGTGRPALDASSLDEIPALRGRLAKLLLELPKVQLRGVDIARAVLRSLGRIGIPLLREGLHGQNQYVRFHTLEIVDRLGPCAHDLGPDVLELLADPLSRDLALRALGRLEYRPAYPHLVEAVRSGDLEHSVAGLGGIGELGDPRAAELLAPIVADESEPLDRRVWAAFSLALVTTPPDESPPPVEGTSAGDDSTSEGAPADPGLSFLLQEQERGDYHPPTVAELIDRIATARRLAESHWRQPDTTRAADWRNDGGTAATEPADPTGR